MTLLAMKREDFDRLKQKAITLVSVQEGLDLSRRNGEGEPIMIQVPDQAEHGNRLHQRSVSIKILLAKLPSLAGRLTIPLTTQVLRIKAVRSVDWVPTPAAAAIQHRHRSISVNSMRGR